MATRYCGPGGNDGNSGLTWALRKLTLNGVEDTPVVAGDICYIGPGIYREDLVCDVHGGSVYNAGTVTVTNGSRTATGAGTAFLANVIAGDLFIITTFASGNDGVANGTATFTSAAGNFQASMVGKTIQIFARRPYTIATVVNAQTITLSDPNAIGWPWAGVGLVYSVMSGEGTYEIESVDDNTTLTLVRAWCDATVTGVAYVAFSAISYIADVTGENTDGVGGIVRVTGSDNDQTAVRANGITVRWYNYRLFRGFHVDMTTANDFDLYEPYYCTIEDCVLCHSPRGIGANHAQVGNTYRRCLFHTLQLYGLMLWSNITRSDSATVVENCIFQSVLNTGLHAQRIGGITVTDCTFLGNIFIGARTLNYSAGDCMTVNDCIVYGNNSGLSAGFTMEMIENYNSFSGNSTDRTNMGVGANSVAYPPLFAMPILKDGYEFPWWHGELSEWSQVQALTGLFPTCHDMRGIPRPATDSKKSWGAVQFTDMERDVGTTRGGSVASLRLADAGRHQIMVPTANQSTTISVYVQREANYAGNLPQLIIKQPGQADRVTTDVGAAGAWNLLTDTFTPAADPPYVFVELVSRNTAAAGNYDTFFEDVRAVPPVDIGNFDTWLTDRMFWPNLAGSGIASPIFGLHTLR